MGRKKEVDTPQYRARWLIRIMTKRQVDHGTGCWNFTGGKAAYGYGIISFCRRTTRVHRFVFEMINGEIPEGKLVCHHCDNPACFNPAHLFLGTQFDNMSDAARKNRIRVPRLRGEKHPQAILTDAAISQMRAAWDAGGTTQADLAKRYNVSQAHVYLVVRRRSRVA